MAQTPIKAVDVRESLVEALDLDLVGPGKGHPLEAEVLPQAPSRWYLTGFLVPLDAGEEQRADETAADEIDALEEQTGGADDAAEPEPTAARRAFFPSSMGMSFLLPPEATEIRVAVRWGDYMREGGDQRSEEDSGSSGGTTSGGPIRWRRAQHDEELALPVPEETGGPVEHDVPNSGGLRLAVSVRPVAFTGAAATFVPQGTRSVSIFVVNWRRPEPDELRDQAFAFQVELELSSEIPLVPRPNIRGLESDDWDERVSDLQYRDAVEHAVGHGVSTAATVDEDGKCRRVRTCWIPRAEVERVAPAAMTGIELGMERLAQLGDGEEASQLLGGFVDQYRSWIKGQRGRVPATPHERKQMGEELLNRAEVAADRIEAGISYLGDPEVLAAFRLVNKTMATAARQRFGVMRGLDPAAVEAPTWRPFQLAFILMNLPGIDDPAHDDRETVDLLFFPTGGGKTEAYLGLAAFTLVLRRLRNPGLASAGLAVLMRYTLRLLTLDQLGRAATLICALELERQADEETLGEWPFEIGLWVGRAATPNRMGAKGDGDTNSARARTIRFQNDDRKPSPIPLEECPWCGTKFKRSSFRLLPKPDRPTDLRITCANRSCAFTRDNPLPILAVDEPIYRRLPCFMIATVDKFAGMPWIGDVGKFFGRADRSDGNGFYGPCEPGRGRPLPESLLPPDLVIQDELHLISGPLGTMVGLYETALDGLCTRTLGDRQVRPKIVASTATVRRAEGQIRALFDRRVVDVFPPPGPDVRNSFFARTHTTDESSARLYVGIAAQGRSLKVVLLRTYLALLGAAQKAYLAAGGNRNKANPVDPYMTLVGYFNSLRELGGSRRIVEDEVRTRLSGYGSRTRAGEKTGLFANRTIHYEPVELTSRVNTAQVADAKRRLALPAHEKGNVDVAIATNMISVGLDIIRLGLMVVLGQPKTSAEYIQATSRVGRDPGRPGLVVTLLNVHRPRDRSHYERFAAFHRSFYRAVEATSVTPFSPRALDRGLAGTIVALARHGHDPMTPPKGAAEILNEQAFLGFVADTTADRARSHADLSTAEATALAAIVRDRTKALLDDWNQIAHDYHQQGVQLQYQQHEIGGAKPLLYDFLDPEVRTLSQRHRSFRANRSMRDVEPNVNLWMRRLDAVDDEEDQP